MDATVDAHGERHAHHGVAAADDGRRGQRLPRLAERRDRRRHLAGTRHRGVAAPVHRASLQSQAGLCLHLTILAFYSRDYGVRSSPMYVYVTMHTHPNNNLNT